MQAFDFAIQIVCAAACSWLNTSAAVAGQHPLFMADLASKKDSQFPVSVYIQDEPNFWLKLMPSYIAKLDKEPWRQIVPKASPFFFFLLLSNVNHNYISTQLI